MTLSVCSTVEYMESALDNDRRIFDNVAADFSVVPMRLWAG